MFLEADLSSGDQLMVVKNNYFWLGNDSQPGFIANGDVIRINSIKCLTLLINLFICEQIGADKCHEGLLCLQCAIQILKIL